MATITHTELRAELRDLKLTIDDLAALTGVQPNTVYRWLRPPDAHQALPVPVYVATILHLMQPGGARALPDFPGMAAKCLQ